MELILGGAYGGFDFKRFCCKVYQGLPADFRDMRAGHFLILPAIFKGGNMKVGGQNRIPTGMPFIPVLSESLTPAFLIQFFRLSGP